MRPRIKLDKKAIMIDYATHPAEWVRKRHGIPSKNIESFRALLWTNGITKQSSRAYLDRLKARHARSLEQELKPTLLQRLASIFSVKTMAGETR